MWFFGKDFNVEGSGRAFFFLGERGEREKEKEKRKGYDPCEAANLDVFFFLDFGHFLVLLET